MRGGKLRAGLAAALIAASGLCSAALADDSLEYTVKAAYLVKFIPFIEWPNAAFPAANAPLNICVLGADPFGASLDRAAAGQKVGDHAISVRRIPALDATTSCPILFVSSADPQGAADMVIAAKDKPILTVTDSGMRAHGLIAFVIADNHVRFDIDDAAAGAVGFTISSKLLDLAHNVRRKGAAP